MRIFGRPRFARHSSTGRSSSHSPLNIWPGFVDALSALVLVLLFTFILFILMQFHLSTTVHHQDRSLGNLNDIIAQLQKTLSLTQSEKDKAEEEKRRLALLSQEQTTLLEQQTREKEVSLAALRHQLEQLNEQLQLLSHSLVSSEEKVASKDQEIKDLSLKLAAALKKKMEELAGYRSEFFARLKKILGTRQDIRIVGDRFIFQSEVLFDLGSDKIGVVGQKQLKHFARVLKGIAEKIPPKVSWILRVDGHTDALPIQSTTFPSNWELSAARALSVVKFLIKEGIAPERLVAAGFGEFHPLDESGKPESLARNRRIEFKLDQR